MIASEMYYGIRVIRDDKLPGGTKSVILPNIVTDEFDEYVYASPVYGGFQIALSMYCQAIGKKATIFCAMRAKEHENTAKCREYGANIVHIRPGYLSCVEKYARLYCEVHGAKKIEFGAKNEFNINLLSQRVTDAIHEFGEPDEIWCAVGSGMLIESILKGTRTAIVHGVCVGADYTNDDPRIKLYKYPRGFETKSPIRPDFPSMPNYDLKAWEYCRSMSQGNVIFWNVL